MKAKMRAKTVNKIPTFDELRAQAPQELKDYLIKCQDTPQSSKWHPEGDVYKHIRIVYDRALESGDLNLVIASFFHDLGKADTTKLNKHGTYSAIGHERVSARLVQKYRDWIESLGANFDVVYEVVKEHMRIKYLSDMRGSKQAAFKANPYFDKINQFTPFDNMKNLTDEEFNRYK